MSPLAEQRPDVARIKSSLKDFQRKTVDYVFRRMYLDDDATRRFLVADEVGLGKTLVARGVIAQAVDHLWDRVDRIDVVYICSNGDIARQNINRLNFTKDAQFEFASRLTLLPSDIHGLNKKAVVEHAGDFVNDATEIIGNLRQMNLAQRLDALERDLKEISHLLGRQFDRLGGHLDDIRKSTDELRQAADGIVSRVGEEHERTRAAVDDRIESVGNSTQEELKAIEERQSRIFDHLQAFRREEEQRLDSFRNQSLIATGAVGILVAVLIVLQFV